MQFFYIDYMNGDKKERNIGFLKADQEGVSVGLHGVPMQCGGACKVYAVNDAGTRCQLGQVTVKNGNGMEKFGWAREVGFRDCIAVEIPLYGTRIGKCVLRERRMGQNGVPEETKQNEVSPYNSRSNVQNNVDLANSSQGGFPTRNAISTETGNKHLSQIASENKGQEYADMQRNAIRNNSRQEEAVSNIVTDKWSQLMETYPRVHIFPEAQSVLIKPKDLIVLTEKYHEMATNSFVLHAYYNYRQLLLFCYPNGADSGQKVAVNSQETQSTSAEGNTINVHAADNSYGVTQSDTKRHSKAEYYLGVPGIYYERECRIAEMFGFEGFENGEARMHEEIDRIAHTGCFGYYMKRVEI